MKTMPVLFSGPPGVGKTAIAYAIGRCEDSALAAIGAEPMERQTHYIPLCERDPMEIAGASYLDGGITKWAPSETMIAAKERPCVIILDELTAAHRIQRVAALRYADPSAGLHPDTLVVATCNPPEYAAGAGEPLSAPEISRFRIKESGPDAAIRWMTAQEGKVGLVGRFLRAQPNAALADPKAMNAAVARQEPYATPRGWTRAAESGLDVNDWGEIIGDDGPPQYALWIEKQDLPDPRDILAGKSKKIPKRQDGALATATAVVEVLGEKCTEESQLENAIAWFDSASKSFAGIISPEADILAERYPGPVYRAARKGAFKKYASIQSEIIR